MFDYIYILLFYYITTYSGTECPEFCFFCFPSQNTDELLGKEEGAVLSSISTILMSFSAMCVNLICTWGISGGMQKIKHLELGLF